MKSQSSHNQKPLQYSATLSQNQFKPEHKQKQSFIKFKSMEYDQCYIPKVRVLAKNNQIELGYVYKLKNVKLIKNLDEMKDNADDKCEVISDVKKKGIKDFKINIKRSSQQKHGSIVVAATPFKTSHLLHYFEVKVQSFEKQAHPTFTIGLTNDGLNVVKNKGTICYNFVFTEAGSLQIFRNLNKIEQLTNFTVKEKDRIGCGFIYHRSEVFLTYNGEIIKNKMRMHYPDLPEELENPFKSKKLNEVVDYFNHKFYPFITLSGKKITLQAVFENSAVDFAFPYAQQLARLEKRLVEEQIPNNVDISQESVYGLVLSYFKFNGFDKSSQKLQQEMMAKNMKFYPQNQPIRNKLQYARKHDIIERGKQKKIKKASKRHRGQKVYSAQINVEGQDNDEDRSRSNDGERGSRSSQSSDNQSKQQFYKLKNSNLESRRSKKSIQHQDGSDQCQDNQKRMEQQLSNRINRKKMQKRVEELKRSEQQKFKGERIQIMRNIQEGKLQQALKLLTKSYKRLRLKQKYLEIYFKAHIFLKLYHQQGIEKALQYARLEHKTFTEYENYLMPFFNMKSLTNPLEKQCEFRPLRQILFLICPENKLQFNLQHQLHIFSNFISNLICEDCGFFGSSKLELVLNHYQAVEKKINDLELPIGGIDLQEMNLI